MRNSHTYFLKVSPFTSRAVLQFLNKAKDLVCAALFVVLFWSGVYVLAFGILKAGFEQGGW